MTKTALYLEHFFNTTWFFCYIGTNSLEEESHKIGVTNGNRKIVIRLTISKKWKEGAGWQYYSNKSSKKFSKIVLSTTATTTAYSIQDLLGIISTLNDVSRYFVLLLMHNIAETQESLEEGGK